MSVPLPSLVMPPVPVSAVESVTWLPLVSKIVVPKSEMPPAMAEPPLVMSATWLTHLEHQWRSLAWRPWLDAFTREELWCTLRDLWTEQRFNVILVTHDLRESVFLADTVYVMSKGPGRFVVKREIDLPRPRDLEVTYTPEFTNIVHELRGHIGAMRKSGAVINQ